MSTTVCKYDTDQCTVCKHESLIAGQRAAAITGTTFTYCLQYIA